MWALTGKIFMMIGISALIGIAVAYLIELIFVCMNLKAIVKNYTLSRIKIMSRAARRARYRLWDSRINWGACQTLVEYHHGKDYTTNNEDAVRTGDIISYYYGR